MKTQRFWIYISLISINFIYGTENVKGADYVIKSINETKEEINNSQDDNPASSLFKKIENMAKNINNIPPEEAAKKWLSFFDDFWALTTEERENFKLYGRSATLNIKHLFKACPKPDAWPAIDMLIQQRKKGDIKTWALSLLVSIMNNHTEKSWKIISDFNHYLKGMETYNKKSYSQKVSSLILLMNIESNNSEQLENYLEKFISQNKNNPREQTFELPDLVKSFGEEKASTWIKRLLNIPNIKIRSQNGTKTIALARKITLNNIEKLHTPQWQLCQSIHTTKLYEAMVNKFNLTQNTSLKDNIKLPGGKSIKLDVNDINYSYEKKSADMYYLLGLIIENRIDHAVKFLKSIDSLDQINLPHDALNVVESIGKSNELQSFLKKLLSKNSKYPFWDDYIRISVHIGKSEEMLNFIQKTTIKLKKDKNYFHIKKRYGNALLASGNINDAMKCYTELFTFIPKELNENEKFKLIESKIELAIKFSNIGILLKKKEWIGLGMSTAEKQLPLLKPNKDKFAYNDLSNQHIQLQIDNGQMKEAEVSYLKKILRLIIESQKDGYYDGYELTSSLSDLCGFYYQLERYQDVITLLDHVEHWGASDLIDIYDRYSTNESTLGFIAADSLFKIGRIKESKKILDYILKKNRGFDPGYQLLLSINSENLIQQLDSLYEFDQFEERPLIWKAQLLLQQKKYKEAEIIAQKAISIDPSDGEQGKGDRMRVYSIMANIKEKLGDIKMATTFRNAISAIRLAERADDFYSYGLVSDGIKMYKEALNHFQDAYCIQSRLAVRLANIGQLKEAEVHYKRAYELMPDSFGRMESHCFGCEGVFNGEPAQRIAEQTFTKMVKENPMKPQLHYLLGYLKEGQKDYKSALNYYQKAVELDSKYLNALKKIIDLRKTVQIDAKVYDNTVFKLIEIDPFNHHGSYNFKHVNDLKSLYNVVSKYYTYKSTQKKSLYPLKKSEAKIKMMKQTQRQNYYYNDYYRDSEEQVLSPGEALLENNVLSNLLTFLSPSYY